MLALNSDDSINLNIDKDAHYDSSASALEEASSTLHSLTRKRVRFELEPQPETCWLCETKTSLMAENLKTLLHGENFKFFSSELSVISQSL